jgi:hypothetical protein
MEGCQAVFARVWTSTLMWLTSTSFILFVLYAYMLSFRGCQGQCWDILQPKTCRLTGGGLHGEANFGRQRHLCGVDVGWQDSTALPGLHLVTGLELANKPQIAGKGDAGTIGIESGREQARNRCGWLSEDVTGSGGMAFGLETCVSYHGGRDASPRERCHRCEEVILCEAHFAVQRDLGCNQAGMTRVSCISYTL